MAKQIVYGDQARQAVLRGINQLADAVKVVRSALQHAAAIASLLLTTEALICDILEEKKEAPMPGGGMGGMY